MSWQRFLPSIAMALIVLMLDGTAVGASAQSKLPTCPRFLGSWDNCTGRHADNSGNVYEGEWKDGKLHGQGTHTYANGNRIIGEWRNGNPSRRMTYIYKDGTVYVGETKDGKYHGNGSFTLPDGTKYVGQFKEGLAHGQGTETSASGDKYVGQYKNGEYEGFGEESLSDGKRYVGQFKHSRWHGEGTLTYANGNRYVGQFQNNEEHGEGTFTFAGGGKYVGSFSDGKFSGQGTLVYSDGNKYVGAFKNDKRHGKGTLYAANGSVLGRGIWAKDELVKPEIVPQKKPEPQQEKVTKSEPTEPEPEKVEQKNTEPVQQDVMKAEPKDLEPANVQQKVAKVEQQINLKADKLQQKQPISIPKDERHKVALVIGNGAYEHAGKLKNPTNDATGMAAMLKQIGFDVITGIDLKKREMENRVREFIRQAQKADVALFFYAGHGIQVAGKNYLIPIDAALQERNAIDFELVNIDLLSNYMGGNERVGIILLDACRNNPFTRSLARSLGKRSTLVGAGLAPIRSESGGLLVGFATAPGDVAADGSNMKNSPFTSALLKHLPTGGLEIELAMKRVKAEVIRLTKNDQRPWHNSDLAKEVYLLKN